MSVRIFFCYIVSLAASLVVAAGTQSAGTFKTIEVDGHVDDWDGIEVHSDAIDDDVTKHHDLAAVGVANDLNHLYFMIRVDTTGGDYFGNSDRMEHIVIYIDRDNDQKTGTYVGPNHERIGAEFAIHASRRVKSKTSYEGTLYTGDLVGDSDSLGNFSNQGLPKPAASGGIDEVAVFETQTPLSELGVVVGQTVRIMVLASRSGKRPHSDWMDQAIQYTLAAP